MISLKILCITWPLILTKYGPFSFSWDGQEENFSNTASHIFLAYIHSDTLEPADLSHRSHLPLLSNDLPCCRLLQIPAGLFDLYFLVFLY